MSILPKAYFAPTGIYNPLADIERSLTSEKEYVVYGITIYKGLTYYYICTDDYSDTRAPYYPLWNPAPFFKITDNSLSSSWHVQFTQTKYENNGSLLIAPKPWIDDQFFYDKLTDGEDKDVRQAWLKMKAEINRGRV